MRERSRRHDTRLVFALAIGIVLLRLVFSTWTPLLDPDEGRNAEIGREMSVSGDLVIPHLAGMPVLDKPPALYWMIAALIRVLGPTPLAARLPAAIYAVSLLAVLGWFASRERGTRFALMVVALTATAPLFFVMSGFAIFDMPLALCVTVVWLCVARDVEEPTRTSRRLAAFAAVALGALIKGPVILAWAIGGSLCAALVLRSTASLRWLTWWPGWLLVLSTAGGWFALATLRHPEYPHYAFLEETLGRMTSNQFHRDQPWWFVPATLAAGALPWSLATPWRAPASRTERVALGFLLFAAVFFTLSHSKLVTYLVPAVPMMAWLAASAWADPARASRAAWRIAAVYAAASIALAWTWWLWFGGHGGAALAVGLAFAAAAAVVAATALVIRRPALSLGAALALGPLILATPATLAVRWGAAGTSGEPLAAAIRREFGSNARVRYEHCYSPGTDFALNRTGRLVSDAGHETESNYQLRYRLELIRRGLWTALPEADSEPVDVVVHAARHRPRSIAAGDFYRDPRFTAVRAEPLRARHENERSIRASPHLR